MSDSTLIRIKMRIMNESWLISNGITAVSFQLLKEKNLGESIFYFNDFPFRLTPSRRLFLYSLKEKGRRSIDIVTVNKHISSLFSFLFHSSPSFLPPPPLCSMLPRVTISWEKQRERGERKLISRRRDDHERSSMAAAAKVIYISSPQE